MDWLVALLLYHPQPGIELEPEALGIQAEQVWLETSDAVRIHAFWLPHPGATRALLFLHGNAGNASHRLPNAELLRRLGASVLLLDYRGFGLSEGSPSEEGLYADARAGYRHLVEERGFAPARVVVFGRSLGGAVAVDLASRVPVAGLLLESTFSNLADAGMSHFGPLGRLAAGRFASDAKIARVRAPILFFHGDADETVPHELGLRLFAAALEPRDFETLAGAHHNDTVVVGGRAYLARIRAFLDQVAPGPADAPD